MTEAVAGGSSRRDLRVSVLIGLLCFVVYNANGRAISAGDAFASRYLPFAIWGNQTVLLDPIEALVSQGRERAIDYRNPHPGAAFWVVSTPGGQAVSLYSVLLPVLISPLYLPAIAYVHDQGWTDATVDRVARVMEKLIASFLAALSASLLYVALRRRVDEAIALLLSAAYAFGTTTWVISSQTLWQHGMGELLLVGLILLLTTPSTDRRALAAGLLCGLIVGNRPPDGVLAAALGAYALYWAGGLRRALLVVLTAIAPVLLVLAYNALVVGALGGAYQLVAPKDFFDNDMTAGLAGLLFSPTRGLFVFSSFFLFLILAFRHPPRDRAERLLTWAMSAGVITQILLYSKTDWRAGICWGPRFLTDLMPILTWLLAPVVAALRARGRSLFVTSVFISIAIEAVGALTYTGATDAAIYANEKGPDRLRGAWAWENAPFIASLSHGIAPAELNLAMRGTIEAVEVDGRATDSIVEGQDVVATGWALAGTGTPAQVGVTIDGWVTSVTREFTDRPDVRDVFPGAGPSGWRISLRTSGLPPGDHRLTLRGWASLNGDVYFLTRRSLKVLPQADSAASTPDNRSDLQESFNTAVTRIREHQQERGYWLTLYTGAARFEDLKKEMNTYLTSLLVDLLDPLAKHLGDALPRARRHLSAQIEPSGLVRYHGLPNGPEIGTLGCEITPDTDDTALVWRIAPGPDRRLLTSALASINAYRTHDGLYRTWLAPRAAYQCLDPGRDPNPTDVAIQIHLLQLLAIESPQMGRELCEALRRHIDDDRIWVYYKLSPIVPMLRTTDLKRAGCPLELPPSRTRTTIPGQEVWQSVVQWLSQEPPSAAGRSNRREIAAVLRQLAYRDFEMLRGNPPLVYHNDLTATVPRYYWSEDVGYALWLRLAQETVIP